MNYPHVVVRRASAIYERLPVYIFHNQEPRPDHRCLPIWTPTPEGEWVWNELQRRKLAGFTALRAQEEGYPMCVVFGPRDCVYIDPDGAARSSGQPPSGGIIVRHEGGEE